MNNLIIEQTNTTPKVELNFQDKFLSLVGKSYPENSFDFYEPVLAWLQEFLDSCHENDKIKVILDIDYMNSSSLKVYFDFFDFLELADKKGIEIEIDWFFYEDNDIAQETGEDFVLDFEDLNIKLIAKDIN